MRTNDIQTICPYRGLSAFQEEDAKFFFGRENLSNKLFDIVQHVPVVSIIGPSGSGKSSLIFAGLIPFLRQQERWLIISIRPGLNPFHELAYSIENLLFSFENIKEFNDIRGKISLLRQEEPVLEEIITAITRLLPTYRLLLIVDQFEELYILCHENDTRQKFLYQMAGLCDHIKDSPILNQIRFIFTLRADFLSKFLFEPYFSQIILQNLNPNATSFLVPSMSFQELKATIEEPAKIASLRIENGLTESILDDVTREPGALPLLQFTLTLLWNYRSENTLTIKAYEQIGRIGKSLSYYAEEIYHRLTLEEQKLIKRIFMLLIVPGEGTEDSRRVATRAELGDKCWDFVVTKLVTSRLVVTEGSGKTDERVSIAHEALIREWQRLQEWMNEDREFRVWQERLRMALLQWEATQYDEGALLRGALLTQAEEWVTYRKEDLSQREYDFINESRKNQDKSFSLLSLFGLGGIRSKIEKASKEYNVLNTEYDDIARRITELLEQKTNLEEILEEKNKEVEEKIRETQKLLPSIFISYVHEDSQKALDLYQKMINEGFKPWLDKTDLLPGEVWESKIEQTIQNSDFLLVCLSKNSSVKRKSYMRKEIKKALEIAELMGDERIFIIPVKIEECETPESLNHLQYVNLFDVDGFTKLIRAIKREWSNSLISKEKFGDLKQSNKERLSIQHNELQKEWDLLTEKLSILERDRIVETRTDEKLRLKYKIAELINERQQVEQRLIDLETYINSLNNRDGHITMA